jgi:hypothetical protein
MERYEAPPPYTPKVVKPKQKYRPKKPYQSNITVININHPPVKKQPRYHGPVVNTPPPQPIEKVYNNLGLYDNYREQKRLLQQKHMDELLELEASRVYSFYKR